MKRALFYGFIFLWILHLFFASWTVLRGDIVFSSDIARDFHILREIDQKKVILIGPRSSGTLYHGPFWPYLNYPAYYFGKGNPAVVGWWWVILIAAFTVSGYFVAKALFNRSAAVAYTLMMSLYMSYHAREMINPHGAMMLLPAFFFFFIRYIQRRRPWYLVVHIVLGVAMIQFSLAIGIPFLVSSAVASAWYVWKSKHRLHLFIWVLVPVLLSNFIVFDLRHQHILLNNLKDFVLPFQNQQVFDYTSIVVNRLRLMFTGVELIHVDPGYGNAVLFAVLLVLIGVELRHNRYRTVYLSFLYFYTGFFITSFINKGLMLYFHFFPIFPLVFLIFSSFVTSRYRRAFWVVFIVVYLLNVQAAINDMKAAASFVGKHPVSWKFMLSVARAVYNNAEGEFGYFVFTPDGFAYGLKYAMLYGSTRHPIQSYYFQKKPRTYVIAEPHPYFQHTWWRENSVNIKKPPTVTKVLDNNYVIERFDLTQEETRMPFDPAIDLGLTFR